MLSHSGHKNARGNGGLGRTRRSLTALVSARCIHRRQDTHWNTWLCARRTSRTAFSGSPPGKTEAFAQYLSRPPLPFDPEPSLHFRHKHRSLHLKSHSITVITVVVFYVDSFSLCHLLSCSILGSVQVFFSLICLSSKEMTSFYICPWVNSWLQIESLLFWSPEFLHKYIYWT